MKWSENENKEREKKFLLCGDTKWKIFGFSQIVGVNKVYNI